MSDLAGVGASPGVAIGPVVVVGSDSVTLDQIDDPIPQLETSAANVSAKLGALADDARSAGREAAGDVLQAQSLIAEDDMIVDAVSEHLDEGLGLDEAFDAASTQLEQLLASLPDPYLAARAADVGEVMSAIKRDMAGGGDSDGIALSEPSILVAEELTAAETAGLDVDMVLGFATTTGGATSHVAIIARSLGVPAVVGVVGLLDQDFAHACLDGANGEFHAAPSDELIAEFEERQRSNAALASRLEAVRGARVDLAGRAIAVPANVASGDDIDRAVDVASDGVGLFRTEFLFLDVAEPPTEEAQYELYARAAKAWDDTVVIRTFDIGGDKPADYLDMPEEENPFLGQRGVRIYDQFPDMIDGQLRAALRAAAHGKVAVMVPMVATVDEFLGVKARVATQRAALEDAGVEIGPIELGVMVEVPSVALIAEVFAEHVDFFSIGTNDLTQYTMAADRMLGSLSDLHDPLHPAILHLCHMVAKAAAPKGKSVSVCGLAASDPLAATIFGAIGINKLSVSANAVNLIKATLAAQSPDIVDRVHEVLSSASSAAEVRAALEPHLQRP